jgi:hypothetical protein
MNTFSGPNNLPSNIKALPQTFIIITLLTTCGGGGEKTSDSQNNIDETGTYLLYTSGSAGNGNLFAIDPDNPTTPIPIETGGDIVGCGDATEPDPCGFGSGDYNSNTNILSDHELNGIVYAKTDGKFYKLSNRKSDGLTPVQISNEAHADQVCNIDIFDIVYTAEDLSDFNQSQLVYQLPGSDGECSTRNDNIWKMIRVGMSASDSPITATQPLIMLRNLDNDGSLSGWLVNDAGNIRRCDENFSNCSDSYPPSIRRLILNTHSIETITFSVLMTICSYIMATPIACQMQYSHSLVIFHSHPILQMKPASIS